jgi:hypothetical protein
MLWRKIGRMLVICGALMMVFGASVLPAQGAEPGQPEAQPLLQPSPRPTLAPTSRSHNDSNSGSATGHITGTIIDLTTGAPTPGIRVNVGGVIVTSDANGNYDLWVPAGPYTVALVLDAREGTPAQGQQMVDVAPGAMVVLHLNFRSQPVVNATPVAANEAPGAPLIAPLAQPAGGRAPRPHASPRLPRTSEQPTSAWLWMTFGALLLVAGGMLEFGRMRRTPARALASSGAPRRASGYENAQLLAALLVTNTGGVQPARPGAADSDILLAALLAVDAGERAPKDQE